METEEVKYIPNVSLGKSAAYTATINRTGDMTNSYSPFKNLQDAETENLKNFTTELLNFDLEHPVDIIPLDSYDGSVNLILNDGKNQPRLISSRFSVILDGKFKITDHSGYKDTNIYDEETFAIDTSLKAIAQKIPLITYKGLNNFGGSLPCGAYTFYFKLSDADGNESEVIAESGLVQIFVGGINANGNPDPSSIRMGLEDENSGKSVSFQLTNIDSGFDYIHVLYARSSSGNDLAATDTYHKIIYDFPVFNGIADITITGKELILGISANDLYVDYADIESVKTQTVINNSLFFGNINKKERDWNLLRRASWKILPSYEQKSNIGSVDYKYTCSSDGLTPDQEYSGAYYNTFNTYYRVGYWPEEMYQFGIVYIFNDNSLSPVFSVQGVDFTSKKELSITDLFSPSGLEWEFEPEDYYFDKEFKLNSKGVIRFPKINVFNNSGSGRMRPKPMYIKFDLNNIGITKVINQELSEIIIKEGITDVKEFFRQNDIKGYFFVRRTRIPITLAQGLAIGLTDKDRGALPVIKDSGKYTVQSFLNDERLIQNNGKQVDVKGKVTINAALVPDAELSEATFNQLFVSNKYALIPTYKYSFNDFYTKESENSENKSSTFHTAYTSYVSGSDKKQIPKRKLTVVLDSVKTLTDGEVYFSTTAGNPSEPSKTKDVKYVWNKTMPQALTQSKTLVRGNWGPFVGIGNKDYDSDPDLVYGEVYNIRLENYSLDDISKVIELEFQKRFSDASAYKAITHRLEIEGNESVDCYRGDCFLSLFTHRMFRNFIDPELPTNDKIINPRCWAENYAVRCTAVEKANSFSNLKSGPEGWFIELAQTSYANEIATSFEVLDKGTDSNIKWDAENQYWYDSSTSEKLPVSAPAATKTAIDYIRANSIHKVDPKEQETGGVAGAIKNIFKSSDWTLRGITSINRADVNAVALGEWITFPICSNKNLALRDVDYSNATEQAAFNLKRSFYPLTPKRANSPLRDSNVINQAASISIPHKSYYEMPNVPFIKLEYFTRIINSLRDSAASITNEFKVMLENAYRDYTKVYGPITKIMALGSNMLVVFHHGLGILSISESMSQAKDASLYLPLELNMVLSTSFGSMWKDSIIESQGYIYGVDTVAKVIWRVDNTPKLLLLSQMKVEKFLIDSIDLSEFVYTPYIGRINVKSHYNAFKHDIMFTYYNDILYKMNNAFVISETINGETFYSYSTAGTDISDFKIDFQGYLLDKNGVRLKKRTKSETEEDKYIIEDLDPGIKIEAFYDEEEGVLKKYSDQIKQMKEAKLGEEKTLKWATGKSWSLCYNEQTNTFTTFYDWIPIESENIDNIWFSFDRNAVNNLVDKGIKGELNHLYKPVTTGVSRDEEYARNRMDKAFNTSIPINYIKNNGEDTISFKFNIETNISDRKFAVIGFYLKGTDLLYNISLGVNEDLGDCPLVSGEEWKFVSIIFPYDFAVTEKEVTLTISLGSKNEPENRYGAISDIIVRTLDAKEYSTLSDYIVYNDGNKGGKVKGWAPGSETIDNFYPVRDLETNIKLWKHGFAGIYDNEDIIRPTYWYGKLHEFNFEFIARKDSMHKIYNNLLLISNKAEPHKFEFEVVGEVYDWYKLKPVLKWIADKVDVPTSNSEYESKLQDWYKYVLDNTYEDLINDSTFPRIFGMTGQFKKLPYLKVTDAVVPSLDPEIIGDKEGEKDLHHYKQPEKDDAGKAHSDNTSTTALVYDKQLNEYRVHTEQLANDVRKYGRLRGNMLYLEDLWRIEVRPISFRYAYVENGEFKLSKLQETRLRDKYCKIKIRYSGEDLAIIQGISTLFDYSYA